jgi:hypothetical protein
MSGAKCYSKVKVCKNHARLTSFHPEMALFPLGFVLRVFPPAAYSHVRLGENLCAALPREKIPHF